MTTPLLKIVRVFVVVLLAHASLCSAQDLRSLASTISQRISASGRKSVAVVDFTDLEGNPTRLGRFLAEELSDSLFTYASDFDVIDRTHLKALMQEHKLTTTGLIDPSTARQLGKIAGVQALITGTITPFEESVHISVKVLDTESAKIMAASAADIPKTKTIGDLLGTRTASAIPSNEQPMPPVVRDELSFLVRGCILKSTSLRCTFAITNKATPTRRVWFTEAFFVDDQGRQYNNFGLDFASKTSWLNHTTDLIPDVPVNLTLEVANFADSAKVINAQISYGVQAYEGQNLAFNSSFGKVTITKISITH